VGVSRRSLGATTSQAEQEQGQTEYKSPEGDQTTDVLQRVAVLFRVLAD
jgi:hypothetical protein